MHHFILFPLLSALAVCGLAAAEVAWPAGCAVDGHLRLKDHEIYDAVLSPPAEGAFAVSVLLVLPRFAEKCPATVYFHMYGNNVDREEFLAEAQAMAKGGQASVLVAGSVPWDKPWTSGAGDPGLLERQLAVVRSVRRFLAAQAWVEQDKVCYVGHDYGAMFGAIVAAEPGAGGFRAFALIAPSPRWSDWKSYFGRALDNAEYDKAFGERQPALSLRRAAGVPVLVQCASSDQYVTAAMRQAWADALTAPARLSVVAGANHRNVAELGRAERQDFFRGIVSP